MTSWGLNKLLCHRVWRRNSGHSSHESWRKEKSQQSIVDLHSAKALLEYGPDQPCPVLPPTHSRTTTQQLVVMQGCTLQPEYIHPLCREGDQLWAWCRRCRLQLLAQTVGSSWFWQSGTPRFVVEVSGKLPITESRLRQVWFGMGRCTYFLLQEDGSSSSVTRPNFNVTFHFLARRSGPF